MLHGITQCKNKVIKTICSSSIVYTAYALEIFKLCIMV